MDEQEKPNDPTPTRTSSDGGMATGTAADDEPEMTIGDKNDDVVEERTDPAAVAEAARDLGA